MRKPWGGPQQLMGIGDAAVAMVLFQTGGTMDLGGGEIGGAVQRQQVMAVQIDEAFEHLAALQATEDLAERGPQVRGIDRIQDVPHLRVAGDAVDPIDGAEVVIEVVAAVVEGQQGRVLEREHGKGRHQGIGQGDFDLAGPRVRKRGETGAERLEKGVGGEVLPCFTGSKCHGEPLHCWPRWEDREFGKALCAMSLRNGRSKQACFQGENRRPGIAVKSRFTCRVFGRASILASPSLERRRMTKMPPDGYPALQYLHSVRVSKIY